MVNVQWSMVNDFRVFRVILSDSWLFLTSFNDFYHKREVVYNTFSYLCRNKIIYLP